MQIPFSIAKETQIPFSITIENATKTFQHQKHFCMCISTNKQRRNIRIIENMKTIQPTLIMNNWIITDNSAHLFYVKMRSSLARSSSRENILNCLSSQLLTTFSTATKVAQWATPSKNRRQAAAENDVKDGRYIWLTGRCTPPVTDQY